MRLQFVFEVPPLPCPIQKVQGAVSQQRGDHPTLRGPRAVGFAAAYALPGAVRVVAAHRGFEPLLDEAQDAPIHNALRDHGQQFGLRDTVEVVRQVGVDDWGVAGPERLGNVVHRIMGRSLGPESVRIRTEVGFKDRLDDEFHGHLRHPVSDRRDPQRTETAVRFKSHDASHRLGSVGLGLQITGQFPQKRVYPDSTLYGLEADPITTGAASIGSDKPPGMIEDILLADLVVEGVQAIGRFLLGLGIQLPLQRPDRLRGG